MLPSLTPLISSHPSRGSGQ